LTLLQYPCARNGEYSVPNGTQTILYYSFFGSKGLSSVTIPSTVTNIYTSAFTSCANLASFVVDEANSEFMSKNGVLFSKDEKTLRLYPRGSSNTSYAIPDGTQTIGEYAFEECSHLENVAIPDSVNKLEWSAFRGCTGFKSFVIPATITTMYTGIFDACTNLMSVVYKGNYDPATQAYYIFDSCESLEFICVPPEYESETFGEKTEFCKSSACEELASQINYCYEVVNCSEDGGEVRQRASAAEWEGKSSGCIEYKCVNETGLADPISHDEFCSSKNTAPQCFSSVCQEDGTCSNTTLYNGTVGGCIESITCESDGWKENKKDCKEAILNDSSTPAGINADTASCYDFECVGDGKCEYKAHDKCEKECSSGACQNDIICMEHDGCKYELVNGVWTEKCKYKGKCVDTDKSKMTCVKGECVDETGLLNEGWAVNISLNGIDGTTMNMSDILEVISRTSGIASDKIKMGIEIDENGNIVGIIVVVTDEEAARTINELATKCSKDKTTCEGILQQVISVHMLEKDVPAGASRAGMMMKCFIAAMGVMLMLVTSW